MLTAAVAAWVPCPLTVWIAGSVAAAATAILILALWFDRLFEAPGAVRVSSLIEHLNARSVLAVFAHPDDETLAYRVVEPAVEARRRLADAPRAPPTRTIHERSRVRS